MGIKSDTCLFTIPTEGRKVSWEILNSCNLRCKHCCNDADLDSPIVITLDKSEKVISQLFDNEVTSLYVTGGEPFLWDDIIEFLCYVKGMGIDTLSVASNGTTIVGELPERVKDSNTDEILVSLDSHIGEVNDYFRGGVGAFERSTSAIRQLSSHDMFVKVGTVIWNYNIDELEGITETAYDLGAGGIIFSWLRSVGRMKQNIDLLPPRTRYREVSELLGEMKEKWRGVMSITYHRFGELDEDSESCMGGEKILHIDSYGRVSPCSWIAKLLPEYTSDKSVFDEPLEVILRDSKLKRFYDLIERRRWKYGPGCPTMCLIEKGTMFAKDPLYKNVSAI